MGVYFFLAEMIYTKSLYDDAFPLHACWDCYPITLEQATDTVSPVRAEAC